jgi:hypothetical protein
LDPIKFTIDEKLRTKKAKDDQKLNFKQEEQKPQAQAQTASPANAPSQSELEQVKACSLDDPDCLMCSA